MSAPMNMAKRAAAGTLALAVCLSGGALVFAGAANALPGQADVTTTPSTGSATVTAPQIIAGTSQSIADATVTLGTGSWATGDHVVYQLPANVTFNGTPTVTAVKVSGDGTTAPTFSVAALATTDDPITTGTDPVGSARQMAVTFTNSKATSTAEAATSWKLVFSGTKVDTTNFTGTSISLGGSDPTATAATADPNGKIYGETLNTGTGIFGTPVAYSGITTAATDKDVLAYVEKAGISVATGASFVNGGGIQAAPDVTVTEVSAAAMSTGTLQFGFVGANGTPVKLDDSSGSLSGGGAFAATLTVNGTAISSPTFTSNGTGDSFTTPSVTVTAGVDVVKFGNLRFKAQTGVVGPIKAVLISPAASVVGSIKGFQPLSGTVALNDPDARVGGATRYDTAAQLAAQASNATNLNEFVLANGASTGVDALSANYIAGGYAQLSSHTFNPLLLTDSDNLPDATLAALKSFTSTTTPGRVTIHVMGGTSAISQKVLDQITAAFPASANWVVVFQRNAGADRYETAAASALNLGSASVKTFSDTYNKPAVRTAILASGENSADAVVAGGVAYRAGFPLLLTQMDVVPDTTVSALQTLGVKQVVIVGGTSRISAKVESQLATLGINVIRKSGDTRYDTAVAIADWARTPTADTNTKTGAGLGWNTATYGASGTTWAATDILVGNGTAFADVLAAGQVSAGASAATYKPIITTDGAALSSPSNTWITKHNDDITNVTGLGGSAALSSVALNAATNAAR